MGTVGSGWYKAGETAKISTSQTIVEKDFSMNYVFEGWKIDGEIVSTSPTYSFVVDKPIILVTSWRTEANPVYTSLIAGILLVIVFSSCPNSEQEA
ncbi:MAG: hypothetical protein QXH91_09395 [Candidatus Bathyarchaeia archaeon]